MHTRRLREVRSLAQVSGDAKLKVGEAQRLGDVLGRKAGPGVTIFPLELVAVGFCLVLELSWPFFVECEKKTPQDRIHKGAV